MFCHWGFTLDNWYLDIVDFDHQLPCQPSNKPRNHGGAICRNSGMDVANQPTPPPGASLEGVGWGCFARVLLSLTMRLRKKLISINNGFTLVSLFHWSILPPKWWHYILQAITPGQISSPVSPPLCLSISGWLLCVSSSIGGHLRPWRDSFYIIFFVAPIVTQTMGRHLPTLSNPRAPSLQHNSYCHHRFLVGYCVFLLSFVHKANSLPVSLIFKGSLYSAQNRVTNRVERKPGAGRLAWVLW